MSALVRAELLKLRTVALPVLAAAHDARVRAARASLATILTAGLEGAPLQRDDPDLLARAVASASAGNVVRARARDPGADAGVPVRHRDAVVPRHARAAAPGAGRQAGGRRRSPGCCSPSLSVLFALGAELRRSSPCAATRSPSTATVVEVLLGVALVPAAATARSASRVGALVRNQIAAVVAALAWTFIVEQLLVALLPEVGRWTPGGAASAVLQLGDLATTRATCCRSGAARCCSSPTPSSCRWSVPG